MSPEDWDATTWDVKQAYLDGLDQDEEVPISFKPEQPEPLEMGGARIRENVDAGTDVIDLTSMMAELEAGRRKG
jgi:hypothetical protein